MATLDWTKRVSFFLIRWVCGLPFYSEYPPGEFADAFVSSMLEVIMRNWSTCFKAGGEAMHTSTTWTRPMTTTLRFVAVIWNTWPKVTCNTKNPSTRASLTLKPWKRCTTQFPGGCWIQLTVGSVGFTYFEPPPVLSCGAIYWRLLLLRGKSWGKLRNTPIGNPFWRTDLSVRSKT